MSSKSDEPQNPSSDNLKENKSQTQQEQDEQEEEEECGFCLFMKGGGCKEVFINWEKCIEEGEKNKEDIVDKCFNVTSVLKKCMEANSDYYGPVLLAEKAAEKEAINQLNKEKDVVAASGSGVQKDASAASLSTDAATASGSGVEKDAVAASDSKDAAVASGSAAASSGKEKEFAMSSARKR